MSKKGPQYCRHKDPKRGDRAYVQLGLRNRVYLGQWDSEESKQRYHQVVAEYLQHGPNRPAAIPALTVLELVDRFWAFAEGFYVKQDGSASSSLSVYRMALRVLVECRGNVMASRFGPLDLQQIRESFIRKGLARPTVNKLAHLVRRVFKWGVSKQVVPSRVYEALLTVEDLRRGRSNARETPPVLPVPQAAIDEILPHVSHQVRALIQLQLLTGARPGELVQLRPVDLDTNGKVWSYRPPEHKGTWRGHGRTIFFGPQAQDILAPFLDPETRPVGAYCFSPAEAEADRRAEQHARRKTPLNAGNSPGTNRVRRPQTQPGDCYTAASYRVAIQRACLKVHPPPARLRRKPKETTKAYRARLTPEDKAELKAHRDSVCWHPHQLRHNAATRLRAEQGLELAQTILGHRTGSSITEIYAEANVARAKEIMARIG